MKQQTATHRILEVNEAALDLCQRKQTLEDDDTCETSRLSFESLSERPSPPPPKKKSVQFGMVRTFKICRRADPPCSQEPFKIDDDSGLLTTKFTVDEYEQERVTPFGSSLSNKEEEADEEHDVEPFAELVDRKHCSSETGGRASYCQQMGVEQSVPSDSERSDAILVVPAKAIDSIGRSAPPVRPDRTVSSSSHGKLGIHCIQLMHATESSLKAPLESLRSNALAINKRIGKALKISKSS